MNENVSERPHWQFKPGFDPKRKGNGRKPGVTPFADLMRKRGEMVNREGKTVNQAIVDKVSELAEMGHEWAVKLMIERTEGKVKETIDLNHSTPELRQLADDELTRIAAGD